MPQEAFEPDRVLRVDEQGEPAGLGVPTNCGWRSIRFASSLVRTVIPVKASWMGCILGEYAFAALCNPTTLDSSVCISVERVE